jgi:hypothetical protein
VTALSAAAQQPMKAHALAAVSRTTTEPLATVSAVRALPGGKVLVNDIGGRRLLMFDSTLSTFTVVADTTSATANAYGGRSAGLIPYRGDSTLFVDPASMSMLVIDPAGKIARTMAAPRPTDVFNLIGGPNGTPGFDSKGRLVYRGQATAPRPATPAAPRVGFQMPAFPDSAPVVRFDFETRKLDTVALFKVNKPNMSVSQDENGRMTVRSVLNPLPQLDDWAILSDGSVAVIRGRDYHIDWIGTDGAVMTSPKIPFDWRHMNDEEKTQFIDSAKVAMEKMRADAMAKIASGQGITMADAAGAAGMAAGMGGGGGVFVMRAGGGGEAAPPQRGTTSGATPNAMPQLPPIEFVPINELPDYVPPFGAGAARGDADGNLWIRTSAAANGGAIYDIISRKGALIDRVAIPAGRVIAGFGPGGTVYMGVREGTGSKLERARVGQSSATGATLPESSRP